MVELASLVRGEHFEDPSPIELLSDTDTSRAAAVQLKALFDKHGSDKATPHAYHHMYASILAEPDSVTAIIEVGIGTNNTDVVSNMGTDGRPGASLRAFFDFLPHARIYGADVDRGSLFENERIRTFYVDQTDPRSFDAVSAAIDEDFDLIIDDGLHSPNANIATLMFAVKRLKKGGWFVVEDIAPAALPVWQLISIVLPKAYKCQILGAHGSLLFLAQRSE